MPAAKKRTQLKPGTEFAKTFRGKTHKLKVVKSGEGVAYELNGTTYTSPSTAAKSLTKSETNGWKFWKMD